MKLKQSWLYQQLERIYGSERLEVFLDVPATDEYLCFPIREGLDTLGWVGVQQNVLGEDSRALITILVESQNQFLFRVDNSIEHLWKRFMEEDISVWREEWNELGYPEDTSFRNVYIMVQDAEEVDHDLSASLKEIIEGMTEERSFLLPLYAQKYAWIIPHSPEGNDELQSLLKGVVDTIIAECMIDVHYYLGQPYLMPMNIREQVKKEISQLELAIHLGIDQSVTEWKDLMVYLLLNEISPDLLHELIHQVMGPTKEDSDLIHSLKVFFQENLNVSETAKKLFIHRNSLQYRLEKFDERTGLDVRRFEDAVKVYLAIQALGMFNKK
ncbi:PucR family transcriptional regulator [Caldalkalibacillus mannanilyticus]|uniref:PucR family transcriptional regulator n=1 Tax=Caldalkalibacillus mannanilyticus TaxID=1418 RepID=UPI00046A5FCC|nr:helix-turn-helix domain-containing protein [Caldalkalibacillus mannanilyticus]